MTIQTQIKMARTYKRNLENQPFVHEQGDLGLSGPVPNETKPHYENDGGRVALNAGNLQRFTKPDQDIIDRLLLDEDYAKLAHSLKMSGTSKLLEYAKQKIDSQKGIDKREKQELLQIIYKNPAYRGTIPPPPKKVKETKK